MSAPDIPVSLPTSGRKWSGDGPVKLSIVMAAYNEERTITAAIDAVLAHEYPCEMELIVVDDGSSDRTPLLLAQHANPAVTTHRHSRNLGKGAALLTAGRLATGTHILPFDADLEYSPDDIPRLLEPVLQGRCDVVYGARLFGLNTVYQSYRYALGNELMTLVANVIFDAHLADMHTCLKLIPLSLFRSLHLHSRGFGLDTEITASLLRLGIRPFEVPVSYYSRSHAEGKKISWQDALNCFRILGKVRFMRRERVGLSSATPQAHVLAYPMTKPSMDPLSRWAPGQHDVRRPSGR
ncbi:glycosyltransferase family 2 protein [Streptomyces griseorubiginosus]|uniref:glycosyltransferase family 2 protein n=1 Tax=Streptomyces griseorubiginosus TaxID=67304 RepID=UPI0033A829CB